MSRRATTEVSSRRATGLVNGRISRIPKASVTNPGESISVPPIRISAPSASSRAGIRPLLSAVCRARHARPPSRLMTHAPRTLSKIRSRMVHHAPMICPTWIRT